MNLLLWLFTTTFLFIAFISSHAPLVTLHPFSTYYAAEVNFIIEHKIAFLIGFLLLWILVSEIRVRRTKQRVRTYLLFIHNSIRATFIGSLLAFALLFCIAFIQINISALVMNINPNSIGLQTSLPQIITTLQSRATLPQIITVQVESNKTIIPIVNALTGTENFYGKYMIPFVPEFAVLSIQSYPSSVLLIDNTLLITRIDKNDLETISPILGYLFVKHYFPMRQITSYPQITLMDKTAYQTYRKNDTKKMVLTLHDNVKKTTDAINT